MKKIRSVCIDEKYWKMLKEIAESNKRSLSNMIEMLIEEYNKNNK